MHLMGHRSSMPQLVIKSRNVLNPNLLTLYLLCLKDFHAFPALNYAYILMPFLKLWFKKNRKNKETKNKITTFVERGGKSNNKDGFRKT